MGLDARWKIKDICWEVRQFLVKKGVGRFFTTDGDYFRDEEGNGFCCGNFLWDTKDGFSRMVETPDFNRDLYYLIRDVGYIFMFGSTRSFPDIRFIGREPLANAYNGALIQKMAKFGEGSQAGSVDFEIYAILLVRFKIERHQDKIEPVSCGDTSQFDDVPF